MCNPAYISYVINKFLFRSFSPSLVYNLQTHTHTHSYARMHAHMHTYTFECVRVLSPTITLSDFLLWNQLPIKFAGLLFRCWSFRACLLCGPRPTVRPAVNRQSRSSVHWEFEPMLGRILLTSNTNNIDQRQSLTDGPTYGQT